MRNCECCLVFILLVSVYSKKRYIERCEHLSVYMPPLVLIPPCAPSVSDVKRQIVCQYKEMIKVFLLTIEIFSIAAISVQVLW